MTLAEILQGGRAPDPARDGRIRTTGVLERGEGRVPVLDSRLTSGERVGHWRVLWGIGRHRFRVPPGLYALGRPGPGDPVLATGNYRWSVDLVRVALSGRSVWLLVLDTDGINVWCAAGKGTFGSAELVRRLKTSGIEGLVDHRRVIVPQLGAVSMEPHHIRRKSGWTVDYGPVRAADLPGFLENVTAGPDMRRVRFTLADRLRVLPVEIRRGLELVAGAAVLLVPVFWFSGHPDPVAAGLRQGAALLPGLLAGLVTFGALLPLSPFRSFGLGGLLAGVLWLPAVWLLAVVPEGMGLVHLSWSAWLAFSLTGSSTFTSLSGVRRESRWLIPLVSLGVLAGLVRFLSVLWR